MHLLLVARDLSGETPELLFSIRSAYAVVSLAHSRVLARALSHGFVPRPVDTLPQARASLLIHMHNVAQAFVCLLRRGLQLESVAFQTGFHSVPSLVPLHMHVMSRDFDRFGVFV